MARNGFKVFDSDLHVMEPPDLWQRYLPPQFRAQAPIGLTSENVRDLRVQFGDIPVGGNTPGGRNYERNQRVYADHSRRGWGPDAQLEAMDVEGVDVAVLYPSRGLRVLTAPGMEPRLAAAIATAYNDWLHDFVQADPRRMLGAGMISAYDVPSAIEEVHRVVLDLGFKAVFLRANFVNGRPWNDPAFEPLWDTLAALDVPLGFHDASGSWSRHAGDAFEMNFGLRRIVGQPFEQMLAVDSFVAGGVLARHPKLRVAFLEANCSWVPWLVWRMDESWELEGDVCMPDLGEAPSAYFRRQCWVSVEPDEAPVRHYLADFGNDRLVYSTDYPHADSRYPKATATFLGLPLSDEDKRKILWDNCARFYAVTDAVPA